MQRGATGSTGSTGRDAGLIRAAVAVRVVAALALVLGPWVDEAAELSGWDVERFLVIAREAGRAWRDHAVEYPPGSVAVFEALDRLSPTGSAGLVAAHRVLVVAALALDLAVAGLLGRRHRRAALAYLMLGLPLVPMGLLRLDLAAALPAVAAAVLAVAHRPPIDADDPNPGAAHPTMDRMTRPAASTTVAVAVGFLVAAGTMVKLWPALLIPALWAVRRDRAAVASVGACALATAAWLLWAGAGLDPIRQVIDLRGSTGWHIESVGGVVTALADATGVRTLPASDQVRLEFNAFRIGTLVPGVVTVSRVVAVTAVAALTWRARRITASTTAPNTPVLGAVMVGCVAALIVTSPLLSPQFLLWLTPWAALLLVVDEEPRTIPAPVLLTAGATVLTGAALAIFGPPDLAHPVAAAVLAVRNLLLIALPVSCWRWLGRLAPPSRE